MLEGGYGIAPNVVLYDTNLPDAAFRLFVIISSHCAERGYCWASNEYLSNLVGKHKNSIPRLLSALEKYIVIEDGYNERRKIRLRNNVKAASQKRETSLNKNVKHNNTKEKYKEKRDGKPISVEKYLATHFTHKPTPTTLPSWVIDERVDAKKALYDNEH
jgi:hypothetical protein